MAVKYRERQRERGEERCAKVKIRGKFSNREGNYREAFDLQEYRCDAYPEERGEWDREQYADDDADKAEQWVKAASSTNEKTSAPAYEEHDAAPETPEARPHPAVYCCDSMAESSALRAAGRLHLAFSRYVHVMLHAGF